jgi:predicted MPP superfamily phosphohydrolase
MIFLLVSFGILILTYSYIGWRLIGSISISTNWKIIIWLILILFIFLPLLPILFRIYSIENYLIDLLAWVGYLSLGLFSMLFTFLVIRDLVWFVTVATKKSILLVSDFFGFNAKTTEQFNPDRRRFLAYSMNIGILGISGSLAGYGFFEARCRLDVVEISVSIHGLPDDLEGFRIVQITDIHVGPTVKRDYVQTAVELVNRLTPDVIAVTGDLADGSVPHLRDDVSPLADLSARYGCYFVTGNHEYYSGADAWVEEVDRLGLTVLMNEHRVLQHGTGRILLAGIADYSAEQFIKSHASNPEAALSGAQPCHLKILMAHQPRSIYAAAQSGFDLQISGHTHGGQFFPWGFLVALGQPYIAELHKYKNTWIYVSRGTGYWGPPLRLGAKSEIALIKLTRA